MKHKVFYVWMTVNLFCLRLKWHKPAVELIIQIVIGYSKDEFINLGLVK